MTAIVAEKDEKGIRRPAQEQFDCQAGSLSYKKS
jgi:hypothetical protein